MLRILLSFLLITVAASAPNHPSSKWQTLTGEAPAVIARGGYSGVFPDSSTFAYKFAVATTTKDIILYCDLQMTKDGMGMCRNDIRLDNSTTVSSVFPKGMKEYVISGEKVRGYFSVDFTSDELYNNVSLIQNIFSRPSAFDASLGPFFLPDLMDMQPPRVWINVQCNTFFKERKLDALPFLLDSISQVQIDFISSPEISFLKTLNSQLAKSKKSPKLILRFLSQSSVEPTTNQPYSAILQDLKTVKSYASGILIPKDYVWPVNKGLYLEEYTGIVNEAHNLGLEVFVSGFANDWVGSYNDSYDPTAEILRFVDGGNFSVDGILTDFPSTATESIACLAHNEDEKKKGKVLIISHNGASGVFPPCTDLSYTQAVSDGADIIDCSVQLTKDGIPFCLDSPDLTASTTAVSAFMDRSTVVNEIQPNGGVFSFDLTWDEILTVKPQMDSPLAQGGLLRNPAAKNSGKFMTLNDFLTFAKNSSVSGILINIENAPYLASKKGLDIVKTVSDALTNASYDKQTKQKVLLQSDDTSVLASFKKTSYERVLRIKEGVTSVPALSASEVKLYADSVNIQRTSLTINTAIDLLSGYTDVVKTMQNAKLSVYVSHLRNEFQAIAYDFFSDPMVEIATYVNGLGVDGLVTDFPSTAFSYFRSPCSVLNAKLPYTILASDPGSLLALAPPESLPPAAAPGPVLDPADVVDPPLPPVIAAVSDQSPPMAAPAGPAGNRSGQNVNVASVALSVVMIGLSFVCLRA
ncbi:hypothetical protein LUZ60_017131 [Juncus effusus]|nr:hypothetical protein LUZ60_017131 [Juncus effusus]